MELDHHWRKSSYSGSVNTGNCVEAGTTPGAVLVRDTSDNGSGPVLAVTPGDWARLIATLR
jgi:hypothetical protein